MEVTIKDVARLAEVSVATVSRVLNNSSTVSPETTKHVNDAIKELDYRPNFLGRNLRKRETHVILALMPSTEHTYYSEILHGMQIKGYECGYDIFMSTTNSYPVLEKRLLEMLSNRTVDAAVLMGTILNKDELQQISESNCIALCCESVEGSDVLTVMIDNEQAAYEAIDFLIKKGHRKIAMISTDVKASSSVAREKGYRRALEENDILFDEKYIYHGSYDYRNGENALERFMNMDEKPTAVFTISDHIAAGVMKKAKEMNIAVGTELDVIGFDNISMSELYSPSISSVDQSCFEMGKTVIELVIENLSGHKNHGKVIIKHKLVLRESTGNTPSS